MKAGWSDIGRGKKKQEEELAEGLKFKRKRPLPAAPHMSNGTSNGEKLLSTMEPFGERGRLKWKKAYSIPKRRKDGVDNDTLPAGGGDNGEGKN